MTPPYHQETAQAIHWVSAAKDPTGMTIGSPVLIVIRGNSASGKSAVAAAIRTRFGRGIAIVSQDNLRRVILREQDLPGGANIALIDLTARLALAHGFHVIVEGTSGTFSGLDEAWPGVTARNAECEDLAPPVRQTSVAKVKTKEIGISALVQSSTVAPRATGLALLVRATTFAGTPVPNDLERDPGDLGDLTVVQTHSGQSNRPVDRSLGMHSNIV